MKNHFLFATVLVLLLSACGQPITYIGARLTKTNSIDVFYSTDAVKRNYKVIGHLASHHYRLSYAKERFINRAKRAGGDAVIIFNADTLKTDRIVVINADVLKYN